MKKCLLLLLMTVSVSWSACSNPAPGAEKGNEYTIPAPGTIVAVSSMPIKEDKLNNYTYLVKVKATDNSKYGVYDVYAAWGNNTAQGSFTMPRGGERLKPIIRKGTEEYTYIIGFNYGSDKMFYDYYEVSAMKGQIKMKYLKAYSFK